MPDVIDQDYKLSLKIWEQRIGKALAGCVGILVVCIGAALCVRSQEVIPVYVRPPKQPKTPLMQAEVPTTDIKSFGEILSDRVILRNEPKSKGGKLKVLHAGETIKVLDVDQIQGKFLLIKSGDDMGWVSKKSVRKIVLPADCTFAMQFGSDANGFSMFLQWPSRRKEYNTAEIWSCIVPTNLAKYRKTLRLPKTFSYALQHISVDCARERWSLGQLLPYSATGTVAGNIPFSSVFSEPLVPHSLGMSLANQICYGSPE